MYPTQPALIVLSDAKRQVIILAASLREKGYVIDLTSNIDEASRLVKTGMFDAVVLDGDAPLCDSLSEVVDSVRPSERSRLPLLVLISEPSLAQKIKVFEAGVDDVVCNTCAALELDARLKALIRRARSEVAASLLQVGELELDMRNGILTRHGERIHVPPIGMKILATLMHQSPETVPRAELLRDVWGANQTQSDSLKSHICTLRKAIARRSATFELQTVAQSGYRIIERTSFVESGSNVAAH